MALQVEIPLTIVSRLSLLALVQGLQLLNRINSLVGKARGQVLAIVEDQAQPLAASQPPQVQEDKREQKWLSLALPTSSSWSTLRGKR